MIAVAAGGLIGFLIGAVVFLAGLKLIAQRPEMRLGKYR